MEITLHTAALQGFGLAATITGSGFTGAQMEFYLFAVPEGTTAKPTQVNFITTGTATVNGDGRIEDALITHANIDGCDLDNGVYELMAEYKEDPVDACGVAGWGDDFVRQFVVTDSTFTIAR
jgi:hypothetical protein